MTHAAKAVAIYVKDYRTAVDNARKIITGHQFNNEPLRILIASLSSGLLPTDAFITSTLQKHLFREMKLSDTAVKNPEMLKWNSLNKRYAPTGSKVAEQDQDENENDEVNKEGEGEGPSASTSTSLSREQANLPPIPTKFNPVIIAIYGQICISAKSYQSAICAFEPLLC